MGLATAHADGPPCQSRAEWLARLAATGPASEGEPLMIDLRGEDGSIFVLTLNPTSGAWTIGQQDERGVVCFRARGTGYRVALGGGRA